MRRLTLALLALTLTACSPSSPAQPTSPESSAAPSAQPSTAPVQAALKDSCRVTIDGQEAAVYNKQSKVFFSGASIDGRLALSNGGAAPSDRGYTVEIAMRAQGSPKGLAKDFKPEDITRMEIQVSQFIFGKSRGNSWVKTVDVPSSAVKSTLKHDGDRLSGSIELTAEPEPGNESTSAKPIVLRYEFENALTY